MLRPAILATVAAVLAALLAAAVVQMLLSPRSGEDLAAVEVAPPDGPSRDPVLTVEEACTRVSSQLPEMLVGLQRRFTVPAGERVAAWGDPPVVLRCGVDAPPEAGPAAQLIEIDGVLFLPGTPDGDRSAATVVDRAVYVQVAVPGDVDAAPVYRAVAAAVEESLPDL